MVRTTKNNGQVKESKKAARAEREGLVIPLVLSIGVAADSLKGHMKDTPNVWVPFKSIGARYDGKDRVRIYNWWKYGYFFPHISPVEEETPGLLVKKVNTVWWMRYNPPTDESGTDEFTDESGTDEVGTDEVGADEAF